MVFSFKTCCYCHNIFISLHMTLLATLFYSWCVLNPFSHFPDRIGGRVCRKTLHAAKGKDAWDFGGQWVSEYVLIFLMSNNVSMCTTGH